MVKPGAGPVSPHTLRAQQAASVMPLPPDDPLVVAALARPGPDSWRAKILGIKSCLKEDAPNTPFLKSIQNDYRNDELLFWLEVEVRSSAECVRVFALCRVYFGVLRSFCMF